MQSFGTFATNQEVKPFPVERRFNLFLNLAEQNPEAPEKVKSTILSEIFLHDLYYFKSKLVGWSNKKDRATEALQQITLFFDAIDLTKPINFEEHAYYCFALSAFASGVTMENLAIAYDRQLETMVTGTIHPKGKWSIKEELENQYYGKYLYHVSETGIVDVRTFNRLTAVEVVVNDKRYYYTVGIIAAACGEELEFDGVRTRVAKDATGEQCTSLCVQNHDFIHRGFAKYAVMHDANRYWACVRNLAIIHAGIEADDELRANPIKYGQVHAAYFMWTHELTTSAFVHGWPRHLPHPRFAYSGQHASGPQIILRITAKLGCIPALFASEIKNEAGILQSLGVPCLQDPDMSEHQQIKEVMQHLSDGYQYLHQHFGEIYGHQGWFEALTARLKITTTGHSIVDHK